MGTPFASRSRVPKDSPVVLIGSASDAHVAAVKSGLLAAGHEPLVLDAEAFPEEVLISLGVPPSTIDVDRAPWPRPRAVYLRSLHQDPTAFGVDADEAMAADWRSTMLAYRERASVLAAIAQRWELAGVPIYNAVSVQGRINKPLQLALLRDAGLPVPATLWTNDPDAARQFCREHVAIYKPVTGGAATRRVGPADLTDERLESLAAAPVCFQELLPGSDIRVYVLDGRVAVSLRIIADDIDFRGHEIACERYPLDDATAQHCVDAARVLGLRWTGMDLKGHADGRLRILELNSSPMFLGFDLMAGTDICGDLTRALLAHG